MSGTSDNAGSTLALIDVTERTAGHYEGVCIDGTIGRVFGGQALAQALRAASATVDDARPVHSLHAYFVSPGRSAEPIDYRTRAVKTGRTLDVVSVESAQAQRTLVTAQASFHHPEDGATFQLPMPRVADPDELPPSPYVPPGTNPAVRAPFDVRYAEVRTDGSAPRAAAEVNSWVRTRNSVDSDRSIDHAALLVFSIDFLLTRAAHVALGDSSPQVGASLDHTMWFHRPFRSDDWLLVSSEGIVFAGSRSLCTAHVYTRDGTLVATATQEALIRTTPASTAYPPAGGSA